MPSVLISEVLSSLPPYGTWQPTIEAMLGNRSIIFSDNMTCPPELNLILWHGSLNNQFLVWNVAIPFHAQWCTMEVIYLQSTGPYKVSIALFISKIHMDKSYTHRVLLEWFLTCMGIYVANFLTHFYSFAYTAIAATISDVNALVT